MKKKVGMVGTKSSQTRVQSAQKSWNFYFFEIPGSDMCNHFRCMFLASIDRKFAGDYEYVI